MTFPNAPGWYQDPTGRRGDARWWDGESWTQEHVPLEYTGNDPQFAHIYGAQPPASVSGAYSVVSPAAGGAQYEVVIPQSNYGNFSVDQAVRGLPDAPAPMYPTAVGPEPAKPQNKKVVWFSLGGLGIVALVITLLITTGAFSAGDPNDAPDQSATGSYGAPSDPSKVRIIDKASGISYDYLGEGWKDFDLGVIIENQETVGEYIVTQPKVPTGGTFIAQVTSGLLSTEFGSPSPGEFPATLESLEASVRGNYYPQPNEPTNAAEEPLTIDGHEAYRRSFDLTWDVDGYDSTGERVMLLLIDTGKDSPVFMYLSFPNTHAELYPLMDQVINSIKVDA